jgi:hypothetical protein
LEQKVEINIYNKCPKCGAGTNTYRHPKSKCWCVSCNFVLRDEGSDKPNFHVKGIENDPLFIPKVKRKHLLTDVEGTAVYEGDEVSYEWLDFSGHNWAQLTAVLSYDEDKLCYILKSSDDVNRAYNARVMRNVKHVPMIKCKNLKDLVDYVKSGRVKPKDLCIYITGKDVSITHKDQTVLKDNIGVSDLFLALFEGCMVTKWK